ncbi:MAG: dimethylmenaquinone methyltransferase [Acidobacteria bacterium]|nr:dimethylmenaquinone methyltransferase [Acidobacteriota bacterium]
MRFLLLLCGAIGAQAQIFTFSKEQMIKYTSQNPFERFEDGRPKAPDALLEKMRGLSVEEVWGVLSRKGFPNQYEGNWRILHPGKKLVGRAVTAQFMPARGDLNEVIAADGKAKGYRGGQNQWVIDMLRPGDVVVVDLFGKIEAGTFVGDNLATAIQAATRNGGMVIDGAIRDLEGIYPIDMAAYFRGAHPAALGGAMLTGVNIPIRVGNTTVMPGDIVFGDRTGVYFIPPHLAEEIVRRAEVTHIHDEWTKSKFQTGKYKSTDLYSSPHDPALRKEYEEYLKKKLAEREGRK